MFPVNLKLSTFQRYFNVYWNILYWISSFSTEIHVVWKDRRSVPMNMNVSKTNGVKLLAAVMVMAMIVAGVAVVLSDSTVSAETKTSATLTTVENGEIATATPADYYVSADVTITSAVTTDVNLYIAPNADITITNEGTGKLNLYAATTAISNGTVQYDDGLKVVIAAGTDVDVTNRNGVITTSVAGTTADTKAGISVEKTNNNAYYAPGANVGSISIVEGDKVIVKSGQARIAQGSNTMSIDVTDANITVTGAATGSYPTIAGTITEDSGSMTIVNGIFSSSVTDGINAVSDGSGHLTNQVGVQNEMTFSTVYGNITQTANAGAQTPIATLTISANAVYTINAGVTVNATTVSNDTDGTINVLGTLNCTTAPNAGKVNLGPEGYTNQGTLSGVTVKNTLSGNVYEIGGELEKSETVTNVLLNQPLTIPKGMTLTVTGNLGLNGFSITVEGTLEISNRGAIFGTVNNGTTEYIALADGGVISNSGVIGKNMPVIVQSESNDESQVLLMGTSGVEFGTTKVSGTEYLTVTGNFTAISSSKAELKAVGLSNVYISGDVTVANNTTMVVDEGVKMLRNANLAINGTVSGSSTTITMDNGCSVTINGLMSGVTVTAPYGKIGTGSVIDTTDASSNNAVFTFTPVSETGTNGTYKVTYVSGLNISVSRVTVTENDESVIYQRAYTSGTLVANSMNVDADPSMEGSLGLTISGNVYVPADSTLVVPINGTGAVGLTTTGAKLYIDGTVQLNGTANVNYVAADKYVGAAYSVSTTGANATYTTYYTTLANALAAIDGADQKTVYVNVDEFETSVNVKDGQTLVIQYADADDNGVLGMYTAADVPGTAENGGAISGAIGQVDGMLVQAPEGMVPTPGSYVSTWTGEDGTVTYSGLGPALANAPAGSTVTIGSATTNGALNIANEITLVVTGELRIGGNLTIAEGSTVQGGNIVFFKPTNGSSAGTITVNGTFDLSEGTASVDSKEMTLVTPGSTIAIGAPAGITISGAQYTNTDGDVVTTSVANAIAYAAENQIETVNIIGTVSETGALTVDGVDIVLGQGAEVTLGSITLTDAKITSTGAELTATVSGLNGEGDAATSGAIALNKSAVVIVASEVVNAAGTTEYTYSIESISGTMTVQSGTVVINKAIGNTATGSKFTVASGATLLVAKNGSFTVQGDKTEFTVEGTLEVDEGSVTFTSGKSVISGTANVSGNGTIDVTKLTVTGTVNVSATENDLGTLNVATTGVLMLGTEHTTIGVGRESVGKVNVAAGGIVIAFNGTDVSGMTVCDNAGKAITENYSTEFYINNGLYMTAYANNGTLANALKAPEFDITGYEITLTDIQNVAKWKDADEKEVTATNVGEIAAMYYTAQPSKVWVQYSAGSQISLYVDGVKVTSGNTVELIVGTHTVTATVNPGYTGEVSITFNGQAVTGGTFEVTPEMTGNTNTTGIVLSATGQISVDTGSTSGSSDGMGLTEILLVILVILIVVMAIMVALRLMRS